MTLRNASDYFQDILRWISMHSYFEKQNLIFSLNKTSSEILLSQKLKSQHITLTNQVCHMWQLGQAIERACWGPRDTDTAKELSVPHDRESSAGNNGHNGFLPRHDLRSSSPYPENMKSQGVDMYTSEVLTESRKVFKKEMYFLPLKISVTAWINSTYELSISSTAEFSCVFGFEVPFKGYCC